MTLDEVIERLAYLRKEHPGEYECFITYDSEVIDSRIKKIECIETYDRKTDEYVYGICFIEDDELRNEDAKEHWDIAGKPDFNVDL